MRTSAAAPPRVAGRRLLRPPAGPSPRFGRLALLLQAVLAVALVAVLLRADDVRLPLTGTDDLRVEVVFPDAAGLRTDQHAPVLVAGVPSGRVEEVRYAQGRAVATLRLDPAARGVVKADAVARIEPRSALEDLTVDLVPGSRSAPALEDGDRLEAAQTRGEVQLDRVAATLDADTRAQVAILLDNLGTGLQDGELRQAIQALRPVVDTASQVTTALDRRRSRLTRLVDAVDTVATAAGQKQAALRDAVAAGRRTLDVTAARDRELRSTISALPGTMTALDGALAETQRLATPLRPALQRLRPTARALPAALQQLQDVVPAATKLVDAAGALGTDGAAPTRRLRRAAEALRPAATRLTPGVAQLEPIVRSIDARKTGVATLGERFSGVLSTNDANGPVLRGLGFFEPFDPANFGFPGATGAKRAKVAVDAAAALTQVCLKENPLACLIRFQVPGLPKR